MKAVRKGKPNKLYKSTALSFACVLCLGLAACGEKGQSAYTTGLTGASEEIAVEAAVSEDLLFFAEEFDIPLKESVCVKVYGDSIYYGDERVVMQYPLSGEAMSFQSLSWEDAPGIWYLRQIAFGEDGSIYALVSVKKSANALNYRTFVCKFNGDGKLVYSYEMTEDLERQDLGKWSSSWEIEADAEGRLYLAGSNFIWMFDPDGSKMAAMTLEGETDFEILDLAKSESGKVYISYKAGYTTKYYIGEIEAFVATGDYENVAAHQDAVEVLGMETGSGGDLLVYDRSAVYQYDLEANTLNLVCKWQDVGIEGNNLL